MSLNSLSMRLSSWGKQRQQQYQKGPPDSSISNLATLEKVAEVKTSTKLVSLSLTSVEMKRGRLAMVQEGLLWSVMNAVTGGIVVTAFALFLQADAFTLGLLTSLPSVAALVQLWSPQLVAKLGSRKRVCVLSASLARVLWFPVSALALAAFIWPEQRSLWLSLFVLTVTLSAAFTAICGTVWLSWAGTMVPPADRATYFSRRNTAIGLIGLVLSILIGFFLDHWTTTNTVQASSTGSGSSLHTTHPAAYFVLFMIAAIFGVLTLIPLSRTPDLLSTQATSKPRFFDSLSATWRYLPLRRYLIFRSAWLFAVGIAVPYYTVYMLQNLHLNFTEIFLLQNIGAITGLITLPAWGHILQKYGCTKVVFWTSWAKVVYVIAWALVGAGDTNGISPFWPLAIIHATLLMDSGLNLASGNLLMNLMPSNNASNVGNYSAFTAAASLVSAAGPLIGGLLLGCIIGTASGNVSSGKLIIGGITISALPFIFILSGLLRALSMAFFRNFEKDQI